MRVRLYALATLMLLGIVGLSSCRADRGSPGRLEESGPRGTIHGAAMSPDFSRVAVAGRSWDGMQHLWIVDLMDGSAASVLKTASGSITGPSWSPDSREVVVKTIEGGRQSLLVVHVAGTGIRELVSNQGSPLWLVPRYGPRGVLISRVSRDDGNSLWLVPAQGDSPPSWLAQCDDFLDLNPLAAAWAATGQHVVFYCSNSQHLREVNLLTRESRVITGFPSATGRETYYIFPSPDGRWVLLPCEEWYTPETVEPDFVDTVWLAPTDGGEPRLLAQFPYRIEAAWSPDSRHVVMSSAGGLQARGLVVLNVDSGDARRITGPDRLDQVVLGPSWTADGTIYFVRDRGSLRGIQADGTAEELIWVVPGTG